MRCTSVKEGARVKTKTDYRSLQEISISIVSVFRLPEFHDNLSKIKKKAAVNLGGQSCT